MSLKFNEIRATMFWRVVVRKIIEISLLTRLSPLRFFVFLDTIETRQTFTSLTDITITTNTVLELVFVVFPF